MAVTYTAGRKPTEGGIWIAVVGARQRFLLKGERKMSLYGVYGSHTVEACPVNNLENGKKLISFAESDPTPFLSKYRINNVLGQYHSAFEHTFLWIVEAEDPHLIGASSGKCC